MQGSTTTGPRVCVGCLAAYNNGKHHWEWVEVTADPDELFGHIRRILASSPEPGAEEWEIMDYEGLPREIGRSNSPAKVCAWVEEVEEADGYGISADTLAEYWERDTYQDVEGIAEKCRDAFMGEYDDLGAFAYEINEGGTLDLARRLVAAEEPRSSQDLESLLMHIDWDSVGRDLELNGGVFTIEAPHGIYVFAA